MSNALALDLMRSAIQMALVVAAPMLVAALLVGLIVGVLQAVTQIQEQTLTFIPKLLVMTLVLVALMPWFLGRLVEYLVSILKSLPNLTA
jgi:flagellar biosynthetic protein FliQ